MASPVEDRSRLRGTTAIALAAALHGLLIGLVQGNGDVEPLAIERAQGAAPIEVEIAAEEGAPSPTASSAAEMDTVRAPISQGGRAPDRRAKASELAPEKVGAAPAGELELRPLPGGEASENVEPKATAPERRIELGIGSGDWSRWVRPADVVEAPAAPERPAGAPRAPASRTGGLTEALEAHDRAVGIGPAGAVLSAARDAAHSNAAPQIGRATFAITLLSTGLVEVELTGANGSSDAWRSVGATMQASLARKPPSIPASRSRVQWKLEIVAEEHWPNGAKVADERTGVVAVPPKFEAVDEAKEDLARRNPLAVDPVPTPGVDRPALRLQAQPPGIFVEHRGKVCNYAFGVTPFGVGLLGGCDPSNIGAKPVRVVATRILSETAL